MFERSRLLTGRAGSSRCPLKTRFELVQRWTVRVSAASGNLEMIDFDCGREVFEEWKQAVAAESTGLVERLVIERTRQVAFMSFSNTRSMEVVL